MDLVGPFKKSPEGCTHLIVEMDKFKKWIEAKPIAMLKSLEATAFFLQVPTRGQLEGKESLPLQILEPTSGEGA